MIYIRKLFTQDLRDGKQIAFPKEPSYEFFKFAYKETPEDRQISFIFESDKTEFQHFNNKKIDTRLCSTDGEARIDGQLKSFIRDDLKVKIEDLLVIKNDGKSNDKYKFSIVLQEDDEYPLYIKIINSSNHTIIDADSPNNETIDSNNERKLVFLDKAIQYLDKQLAQTDNEKKTFTPLNYTPCKDKIISYNRIVFGAPGTGKSYQLKTESQPKGQPSPFANIERVTFHPDYSYGQFIGSYKPVSDDDGRIRYEYVPGPFMRTLVKALESGKKGEEAEKYLLIVEEINRAKVAAVFGDMFQLLDRTDDGESVYEIQASEDVRRYLAKELGGTKDNYTSIKLPNNMYIWATMNSADQGVFPMDTAFKRRWEFEYLGINANDKKIDIKNLPVKNPEGNVIEWNTLRKSINSMLLRECKVNEDKLLGLFFISGDAFKNATQGTNDDEKKKNAVAFYDAFNSKVLMYLFEDAGKMHQKKVFAGINSQELTFSKVCEDFKSKGTAIFGTAFKIVE